MDYEDGCEIAEKQIDALTGRLAESEARVRELQEVCAEAYQLAGAYNASVEALDNLSAAAAGKPLPHKTFLPVINIEESRYRKALEAYVKAQGRMRDRWAWGDDIVKKSLWQELHACEASGREAIADPAPSAQCQADRWKHSVSELGARIKAAEGKCSCPDFPGWCPVHLFNSADWGPIVADPAPSEGKPSATYIPWENAGGPNECRHGYAAGISCPRCDEER